MKEVVCGYKGRMTAVLNVCRVRSMKHLVCGRHYPVSGRRCPVCGRRPPARLYCSLRSAGDAPPGHLYCCWSASVSVECAWSLHRAAPGGSRAASTPRGLSAPTAAVVATGDSDRASGRSRPCPVSQEIPIVQFRNRMFRPTLIYEHTNLQKKNL